MHHPGTKFRILIVALSLVTGVASYALTVPSAGAQQNANIYAMAELSSEGKVVEGTQASSATFERLAGGGTRITMLLVNMKAGAGYQAAIRDGSCSGAVLYSLSAVQIGANGEGQVVTELPAEVEFGRWYVEVSSDGAGSGAALCGQVNPAIAGAPPIGPIGGSPGMPRTGQGGGIDAYWLALLGAALATLGFISYRAAGRRA